MRVSSVLRYLSVLGALGPCAAVLPTVSEAQSAPPAVLTGTVTDSTGAVIRGAATHLKQASGQGREQEHDTDNVGQFVFAAEAGSYILTVEAPGFAAYTSKALKLRADSTISIPVRLVIASLHQEISILDEDATGATDPNNLAGALVFEGKSLDLLSSDPATLRQQLGALAGSGSPNFLIDGFSGGRLPSKSSIRSIRINKNAYSAYFPDLGFGRVEISTKPGGEKLHGFFEVLGTDDSVDARNPYIALALPFYDFQQNGNISGSLTKKTSWFFSDFVEALGNTVPVNAVNPQATSTTISEGLAAPQRTDTFALRVDREFSQRNFGFVRDEWNDTHVVNNGITPLVLSAAAYTSDVLTNTLQTADTQVLGAHAVNVAQFQYIRTRLRQDPNSTLPSVVVQGAFQDGGSPAQVLRDNQDAYEVRDLFEFDHGMHSMRVGFQFRAVRDANESSAGFNGQYIFPDIPSFLAGKPSQFAITTGQRGAVLKDDDVGIFAEDDWRLSPNLTFSYGLRFESQSALPDHSDPAPRIGLAYAIRRPNRKTPIVTLRGGYGLFYDRFPYPQLLRAVRQNGVQQIEYVAQGTGFDPNGPPPGVVLTGAQPSIYQVSPRQRSTYQQASSISALRSLGKYGAVSANFIYVHSTHNVLTRNANAPLPGTFDVNVPNSGVRPLGTTENLLQYSSDANQNIERLSLQYQLQFGARIFAFGRANIEKARGESDSIDSSPSNQYNVRADYGRLASSRPAVITTGLTWTLPYGFELDPFLDARSGIPFDITTGTDLNGDTLYTDRPAFTTVSTPSAVQTAYGFFNTAPAPGDVIPRNYGTSPRLVWLDLRGAKDFKVGPRSAAAAAQTPGKPGDRPWNLRLEIEVQNLANHTNPGIPVGVLGVLPCATGQSTCTPVPSPLFGHSLNVSNDFSTLTAANRIILFRTNFTF